MAPKSKVTRGDEGKGIAEEGVSEEERKRYQIIASKEVVTYRVPSRHSLMQLGIEEEVMDGYFHIMDMESSFT
ncbi:conserved hypothetical protein [Ricinus communis]|uniref:Uncharacterized protein n=1 Tax=Ricinus communis TaxID=3988 RepID=B9RPG3_RICCO|nr:conserved hypothetical protein [Ricinus communis]